ncbi:F-box domain-containing protein [Colletotrichum fioriniae PJ7]|uniref:F-box domain-containing protein n=1 Tax=Colletotrichum fioriniae PJ7 TaxID=1445577 RepID=A0A010S0G9_9PEZI|nr:F-box domain-containing protein [Colletotrichum fioriniae PJ7]
MSGKSAPVNSSQPLTQFSFAIFTKLPPELQLEILSHCQQNDLICISLASHSLRAMMLPLIPAKPSLLSYDQVHPPEALKCECGDTSAIGVVQDKYWHRRKRHVYKSMGDLRYCAECQKFTKRPQTKKYKGRCLHGRPRVRRNPDNHWTAKKGVSYGYRWWRRWGTCGVDAWGYPDGDKTADISRRRNARVV